MLVGIHENRDPQLTKQDYPRTKLVRRFIPGVLKARSIVDKMIKLGAPVWAAGDILIISFKPDLKDVTAGRWDEHLHDLALWIKEHPEKPVYVVFWHEPENDMQGPQFVAMFNHCHDVVKSVHPQITTIHSAMAYQYRLGGKAENTGEWVTKANINTCDVYSGKSFPLGQILPEHPGFKRWYAVFGVRSWGITERGFHASAQSLDECRTRANTIRREAEWLATQPSCIMYIYWNTSGTEDNPDLVLDAKGEEAVKYLTELLGGGAPTPPKPEVNQIQCPTCKGKGKITILEDPRP